jgi:hypothetical protein
MSYYATASNPKRWCKEKWSCCIRHEIIIKNRIPIRTWRPWNPVTTKNVKSYIESAIAKKNFLYSVNWIIKKYKPTMILYSNLSNILLKFMAIYDRAWWDHLIVRPDEIRMTVFCRGILYRLIQTDFMILSLFNSKDNKYDENMGRETNTWSFVIISWVTKWTRRFHSKYFLTWIREFQSTFFLWVILVSCK